MFILKVLEIHEMFNDAIILNILWISIINLKYFVFHCICFLLNIIF